MAIVHVVVSVPVSILVPDEDCMPEGMPTLTAAQVAAAVKHVTDSWADGRYPFDVELLHEGAGRVVEAALHVALAQAMEARFGPDAVSTGPEGYKLRRYVVEARAAEERWRAKQGRDAACRQHRVDGDIVDAQANPNASESR